MELFCIVDDFLMDFLPEFEKAHLELGIKHRRKACSLSPSEIMTIMIYFHQLRFRDFKTFYTQYVQKHLFYYFPKLVSYNRFVELMPSILMPMCFFMLMQQKTPTGVYFILKNAVEKIYHRLKYSSVFFNNHHPIFLIPVEG